jgi:hypothetical protein
VYIVSSTYCANTARDHLSCRHFKTAVTWEQSLSPGTSPDGNDLLMTSKPSYQLRRTLHDFFRFFLWVLLV